MLLLFLTLNKAWNKKIQKKTSECESLSLRVSYFSEREKQEQNMFGQYKSPVHTQIGANTEEEELEQISEALERKNKVIDARFQDLRKRFLEAAESKMEDIKQKDNILDEIEDIRGMYIKIKRENTEFKSQVEILNNKLESKNKLNEHLEEKCANILIEKEDTIIKLKAEIVVIKKRLGNSLKGKPRYPSHSI